MVSLKLQPMGFSWEGQLLLPGAYRNVILGTPNQKVSSTQSLSYAHQENRCSKFNAALPLSYWVGWFRKKTDAAFSVCSLGSSLNLYLDLCLCFHTGLPSLDTMLTLLIFLNTVDSLSGGLIPLFGFIMGTSGIKYLSSLSLFQWSTIPYVWPDQLDPPCPLWPSHSWA